MSSQKLSLVSSDHVCVLMHSEARSRRGLDCLFSELRELLLQESSGRSDYEAREA